MNENVFVGNRKIAIKALTGSHNYNLNTSESDKDFKYFVFPTFDDLYANTMFTNSIVSDTLDATVHDVRHLLDLLWKANLNFIEVLYGISSYDSSLNSIINKRDIISTMNLPLFYSSCFYTSKNKLDNIHKGTGNTQHLIQKYGYDTKEACHAVRLLLSISRYMEKEDMGDALWYGDNDIQRDTLMNIKAGKYSEGEVVNYINRWHRDIGQDAKDFFTSKVPEKILYANLESEIKDIVKAKLL